MPPGKPPAKSKPPGPRAIEVFLNLPYDDRFLDIFLAYIAGLTALGLIPRAALEVVGGKRRLDRICELMQSCTYSIHDLSLVRPTHSTVPRLNMAFELGLTVAWQMANPDRHTWFVFDTKARQIEKSLSDLGGTDVSLHGGRRDGVFSELLNNFDRPDRRPTIQQMTFVHDHLRNKLPRFLRDAGTKSAFKKRTFTDLRLFAQALNEHYTVSVTDFRS